LSDNLGRVLDGLIQAHTVIYATAAAQAPDVLGEIAALIAASYLPVFVKCL
jgi:hypothetical protein